MEKIILVGAGGHCKSVIDVIEQVGEFEIEGILDVPERVGEDVLGYSIIGTDDDLAQLRKRIACACVTVGQVRSSELRRRLFELLLKNNYEVPVIISPLAYVSKHATIGKGTVVMHHAIINAGAKVGKNCIINSKALVEHDADVGDYCHIATGAIVNGGVKIKEGTFFGSNATSKQMSIVEGFVKAGSVVK